MADLWLSCVHLDCDWPLAVLLAELFEEDILAHLTVDPGEAVHVQPGEELPRWVVDVEK